MEILGQSTKTTTPPIYTHLGYLAASGRDVSGIPLIPGVILLVVGAFQLRFRKERHRKVSIATIIGGFLFLSMAFALYLDKPRIPTSIISGTNLKGLGTAFIVYASEHENQLPDAGQWCDILISWADLSPESFRTSYLDINEGECLYAMNENVSSMEFTKIPKDVVLLFETDLGIEEQRTGNVAIRPFAEEIEFYEDNKIFVNRWNQIGGPGDLKSDYHPRLGACVLFGDGHTQFVKIEDIDSLKWTVEESQTQVEATETQ